MPLSRPGLRPNSVTATNANETEAGIPFILNGKALLANSGEMLIDACERNGVHIPRFCYHPRMRPVGMCRMCLVEVDTGRGAGLQPSCMLTVSPEMVVNTESTETKQAQEGVLELTLINHPLDCPVCDKGGECPLQDNAYAYGPGESRFVEEKRHFEKPISISSLVQLDRERCILCDRCTRFADEVAGDPLIHFIDRGSQTQVNTFPDHPFSSYFSGNTVQICPVGALTASPYRFKARPWDLAETESTATVDSTGARIVLQSSQDRLVRVLGVDSDAVNWSWLSDKERFLHEATDSNDRLTEPLVRSADGLTPARWTHACELVGDALNVTASQIGVIGGSRLPLEGQYAWAKLLRGELGISNVDAQLGDGLPGEVMLGLPRATIAQACAPAGVVLILGADPKEELPSLYLRLRHAASQDGTKIIELTPRATGLSPNAAISAHPLPGQVGVVAAAIADGKLDAEVGGVAPGQLGAIAELLGSGAPVTVIVGRGNLAESASFTVDAIAALQRAVPEARFLSGLRRGNVHGALELGFAPGLAFGGGLSEDPGLDTAGILRAAANGEIETLLLLAADPLADFPNSELAADALKNVATVVAVDTFLTASTQQANVVLPAAMTGEVDGAFLNLEGRLSPLRAKVSAPGQARPDWMIAVEVSQSVGTPLDFGSIDDVRAGLAADVSVFGSLNWDLLGASGDGPLLEFNRTWEPQFGEPVVAPLPDGYGLRLIVDRKLWDLGTMVQQSESLRDLPEVAAVHLCRQDLEGLGVSEGDDVLVEWSNGSQSLQVRREVGLPRGVARIPFRLPGFNVGDLLSSEDLVAEIRVTVT